MPHQRVILESHSPPPIDARFSFDAPAGPQFTDAEKQLQRERGKADVCIELAQMHDRGDVDPDDPVVADPARASAITWFTVPAVSAVSVFVIDCTTMGEGCACDESANSPVTVPPTPTFPIMARRLGRRVSEIPGIALIPD